MKQATLIISTYKKIRELELILTALINQTFKDFEIIIADDGSGIEMEEFVKMYRDKSGLDIRFLTQEDKGFRKTKILNNAIKESRTDYLVFIDGDCIPNKDFMKYHISCSCDKSVLCGWRVSLGKSISKKLTAKAIQNGEPENKKISLIIDSLKGKESTKEAEEAFIIRNKIYRKIISEKRTRLIGYNFSIWKTIMEMINGFDENYVGAGVGEDTDIEYRLKLYNVKFKSVRNLAVVYHLYHEKTSEENNNLKYFTNTVKKNEDYFCDNGLIKV